jgi:hypothetical protein
VIAARRKLVDRLAIVGNPQFRRITRGEPEVVIAADWRRDVTADARAIVVSRIGGRLQTERLAVRWAAYQGIRTHAAADDAGPEFASYCRAVLVHVEVETEAPMPFAFVMVIRIW